MNIDLIESKNREISTIRDEYNSINSKKTQIMDQISKNTRSIEDYNIMLEDSRGKKERLQRELEDKSNAIDKGKANLGDLDRIYKEKVDNIEILKTKESQLSIKRDKTSDENLKCIMEYKELLELDPSD